MTDLYAIEVFSAPASEPVSIEEAKAHCRVETNDEYALFARWVKAARELAEAHLDQAFVTQTLKLYLDAFPCWEIRLPRSPLQSVSSVVYVAADGTSTTLSASAYQADAKRRPGRLAPAYGYTWPGTRRQMNAVTITYVAGYGADSSYVPALVKQAILLTVGTWFEFREGIVAGVTPLELPQTAQRLLMSAWDGGL